MPKTVGFMQGYFLIFLFSALFARFMGDTGAAPSIAVKVARIAKRAKNPDMQRWLAVYGTSADPADLNLRRR